MEYGVIEREIHIDASPEVVFDVVSRPEHICQWWSDAADLVSATPGTVGELSWGEPGSEDSMAVSITVEDVERPRSFSFRWVYPDDEAARAGNSLLVTFELIPQGEGTLLRLTETGFRDKGWEVAVLEAAYKEHGEGWDHFLPRLAEYAAGQAR